MTDQIEDPPASTGASCTSPGWGFNLPPYPEHIQNLLSAFGSRDFDAHVDAAKTIIQLAPSLDIEDDRVGMLLLAVFRAVDWPLDTIPDPDQQFSYLSHANGRPPATRHLRYLLMRALEALVGPVSDPTDALIHAFLRGGRVTKIEVADWFADDRMARAAPLFEKALADTSDQFLALVLCWPLANHAKVDRHSLCDALADYMTRSTNQTELEWCGYHLWYLAPSVSSETLGQAVCRLGTAQNERCRQWAFGLITSYFISDWQESFEDVQGYHRIKDCSDDVLEGLTRFAWKEFLRQNRLQEPYVGLHVGARGDLLTTLQDLVDRNQARWDLDTPPSLPPSPHDSLRYRDVCWALRGLLDHGRARHQIEV